MSGFHLHFIATREQARRLAIGRKTYWVSNCFCREERADRGHHCGCSPIDVCLFWLEGTGSSTNGVRRIAEKEVEALFKLAEERHLVMRPFRNKQVEGEVDGVCFCCDDCCWYHLDDDAVCDKGAMIEQTDLARCTACGDCQEGCYFGARAVGPDADAVAVDPALCVGCGVCRDVCPVAVISMVSREEALQKP